ncbi:MAG: carbamoyltransferase N-terminal domain-containing protein, partial [Planctomycetota bacterium]
MAVYVLGINAYDHDVSACLLKDGEVVAAIAKERITRIKHDSGFFQEVVDYCLAAGGVPLEGVDLVARNCYMLPVPEMERRLLSSHQPYHMTLREREQARASPLYLPDSPKFVTCSHHLAHAYSAFACAPFDDGAVMVIDGVGSYRADVVERIPPGCEAHPCAREAESYYVFRGAELECVRKVWLEPTRGIVNDDFFGMPGIGAAYSRVSTYVFGHWDKCGEVMGLAPYGRPGRPRLFEIGNGDLRVPEWPIDLCHPFLGPNDRRWEQSPHRKEWEDLCWRVQEDAEEALLRRAAWLHETTGARRLCLAGGVALNCVANGKLLERGPFREIFIQPAAGDDGVALGCALWGHLARTGGKRAYV